MLAGVVTLEPMSVETWVKWRETSIAGFASAQVRAGSWSEEDAPARAHAEFDRLLPDGRWTTSHHFFSIVASDGRDVGAVWVGPDPSGDPRFAWVWDIVVDEASRGHGYGRAALLLLEPIARELGYEGIRLHVFGDNVVARGLYRSVGYVETDVTMVKSLK